MFFAFVYVTFSCIFVGNRYCVRQKTEHNTETQCGLVSAGFQPIKTCFQPSEGAREGREWWWLDLWQHASTAEDNAIFAAFSPGLQPPPGFQFDQAPGFQPSYDRLGFLAPLYWAAVAAGFQPTDDINK